MNQLPKTFSMRRVYGGKQQQIGLYRICEFFILSKFGRLMLYCSLLLYC